MLNRLSGKCALITGASSGIGKELAVQLAAMNVHLILTGRRESRLKQLADELTSAHGISVEFEAFDVRSKDECISFHSKFYGHSIDILVNNAGLASGADSVQSADISDWESMIDTNLKGMLYLTRLFLPYMISRNQGHILNVGSIAGHESYPGGSVYCATKHALRAFTRSLKMDVGHTNIRVGMISPGAVETEFSIVRYKGDIDKANAVYSGMEPLTAVDIAEIIVFMLNRPDHVNILDTFVVPVAQSSGTMIHRKQK